MGVGDGVADGNGGETRITVPVTCAGMVAAKVGRAGVPGAGAMALMPSQPNAMTIMMMLCRMHPIVPVSRPLGCSVGGGVPMLFDRCYFFIDFNLTQAARGVPSGWSMAHQYSSLSLVQSGFAI